MTVVSRENVDLVLSLYRSVEGRDYGSPLELLAEDVVWDLSRFGLPDVAKVFHGHDGVRAFWTAWLQAWESLEFHTDTEDLGDRVAVEVRQRNRGRASGVEVEFHYFQVFTLRDGRVTAVHVAPGRDEAVAASGHVE